MYYVIISNNWVFTAEHGTVNDVGSLTYEFGYPPNTVERVAFRDDWFFDEERAHREVIKRCERGIDMAKRGLAAIAERCSKDKVIDPTDQYPEDDPRMER